MLEVDETEALNVALLPGKKVIVTGVVGEGSCFMHALMRGLSPIQYTGLSESERTKYVGKLRTAIADNLTVEEWLKGEESGVLLQQYLYTFLKKLKRDPSSIKNSKIKAAMRDNPGLAADINVDSILEALEPVLKNQARLKVQLGVFLENVIVAETIVEQVTKYAYDETTRTLRDISENIGDGDIKYILESMGVMAIFINKSDGTIYNYPMSREFFESVQKILLIAYIPGHYESIGIVHGDNIIRRCFNPADPLIEPLVQSVVKTLF